MAIQDFTAGQVLTALQMDNLQANDYNQTVSTKTASYTLVAADKGTRVVMNSASATTITVNTSLFSAGDTLSLQNIGAGVCTVTAGTATVSSAGPLAIPQNGSGVLYFTSAGVSIYYPSAVTAAPSALVRIGGGTLSGASTTFSSVFSATYQAYLVTFTNVLGTAADDFNLQLGATSTGYYFGGFGVPPSGAGANLQGSNVSGFRVSTTSTTKYTGGNLWLWNPFLSVETTYQTVRINPDTIGNMGPIQGFLNNTTSYTAFTMLMASGSFSAGTVNIYGLALS